MIYPDWFISNTIKKLEKRQNNPPDKYEPDFLFAIGIPFFGKASRVFTKRLNALVKTKFNVDINVYYTCFKTGLYFQLKCSTPFPLLSNVVYKFSCSRDANISYQRWKPVRLPVGSRFFDRPVKPVEKPVEFSFLALKDI